MKTITINIVYLLLLVLLPIMSCTEKISSPDNNKTNFTVSGKVIYKKAPIANALVRLDSALNYSTTTDAEGKFSIPDVSEGTHKLTIYKSLSDGNFTEMSENVAVTGDLNLSELLLPKAVYLYPPTDVTSSSILVTWSPTDAADFREYKVYRHTSPGLDETTGKLIYVATSINDTSFVDTELFESTSYYYRIYVMNEYGRLGGSNITSSKTMAKNLIKNGDFESYDDFKRPTDWLNENDIWYVSDQNFQNGNYGLRGERNAYLVELGPGASLRQYISYTSIVPGKQYIFSFSYDVENLGGNSTLRVGLGRNVQDAYSICYDVIDATASSGWQNYSFTFTAPTLNEDLVVSCYVETNVPYNGEPWIMWLDNFELKRTE